MPRYPPSITAIDVVNFSNKMNYKEAEELATKMHTGQFRKYSGEPYITHPIAVASMFENEDYKIVAVLHDTLEDTALSEKDLMLTHHLADKLVDAIVALTHLKRQSYLVYLLQVRKNEIAKQVKLADIRHNMSDLKEGCLKEKYRLARYILLTY